MKTELAIFSQLFDSQIFIGILGGLFTAVVIFIWTRFVNSYLIPTLRAKFFEGVNLNGKWTVFYTDISETDPIGFIYFTQKGHYVTAEMDLNKNQKGSSVNRKYIYEGKFSSGQLVMRFDDAKAKGVFMGAVVMHLGDDSQTLLGKAVYYKSKEGQVVDTNARFIKGNHTNH